MKTVGFRYFALKLKLQQEHQSSPSRWWSHPVSSWVHLWLCRIHFNPHESCSRCGWQSGKQVGWIWGWSAKVFRHLFLHLPTLLICKQGRGMTVRQETVVAFCPCLPYLFLQMLISTSGNWSAISSFSLQSQGWTLRKTFRPWITKLTSNLEQPLWHCSVVPSENWQRGNVKSSWRS